MRNLIKFKSQYQRSKECVHINHNTKGVCQKCVFWDSTYSHCSAFETHYDKAKMALLQENLIRVRTATRMENPPYTICVTYPKECMNCSEGQRDYCGVKDDGREPLGNMPFENGAPNI
jgi:hypothetical protein